MQEGDEIPCIIKVRDAVPLRMGRTLKAGPSGSSSMSSDCCSHCNKYAYLVPSMQQQHGPAAVDRHHAMIPNYGCFWEVMNSGHSQCCAFGACGCIFPPMPVAPPPAVVSSCRSMITPGTQAKLATIALPGTCASFHPRFNTTSYWIRAYCCEGVNTQCHCN